jgi:hypothetical protein
MKAFSYLLICLLFTSCNDLNKEDYTATTVSTGRTDMIISGMHYIVYNYAQGGLIVINLTKDSLECAQLKNYGQ